MAAPRFINIIAGRLRQIATIVTSAGAADAEKVPSTNASGVLDPSIINAAATGPNKIPILDGSGRLDPSTLPNGVGQDALALPASEALSAGDAVNVWSDAGVAKMRKADATAEGKEANGFVTSAVASGVTGTMFFEGRITGKTGLTIGARYYLDPATPGGIITTAPTGTGNIVQYIGTAVSTTSLDFEPSDPVTLA